MDADFSDSECMDFSMDNQPRDGCDGSVHIDRSRARVCARDGDIRLSRHMRPAERAKDATGSLMCGFWVTHKGARWGRDRTGHILCPCPDMSRSPATLRDECPGLSRLSRYANFRGVTDER